MVPPSFAAPSRARPSPAGCGGERHTCRLPANGGCRPDLAAARGHRLIRQLGRVIRRTACHGLAPSARSLRLPRRRYSHSFTALVVFSCPQGYHADAGRGTDPSDRDRQGQTGSVRSTALAVFTERHQRGHDLQHGGDRCLRAAQALADFEQRGGLDRAHARLPRHLAREVVARLRHRAS